MPHLTLMAIADGIAATFNGVALTRKATEPATTIIAYSYDELKEGAPDTPSMQVIPNRSLVDPIGATDRTTFRGAIKGGEYEFLLRCFAIQRSQIGEDMEATVRFWDLVENTLEDITCDYFGIPDIQCMLAWHCDGPIIYQYGSVEIMGVEVVVTIKVF